MEVGKTVRDQATRKMVQIHAIDNGVATVSIWGGDGQTYTVNLSELEPVTQIGQPVMLPAFAFKPTKPVITDAKAAKIKFDQSLFSEEGVKISCKCGKITRSIAPAYIRSWANENAALNYVSSLCGYCHTPVRFSNATK